MTVYVLTDDNEGNVRVFSTQEKAFKGLEEARQEKERFYTEPLFEINYYPSAKAKILSDEICGKNDFPYICRIPVVDEDSGCILESSDMIIDKAEVE